MSLDTISRKLTRLGGKNKKYYMFDNPELTENEIIRLMNKDYLTLRTKVRAVVKKNLQISKDEKKKFRQKMKKKKEKRRQGIESKSPMDYGSQKRKFFDLTTPKYYGYQKRYYESKIKKKRLFTPKIFR